MAMVVVVVVVEVLLVVMVVEEVAFCWWRSGAGSAGDILCKGGHSVYFRYISWSFVLQIFSSDS